MSDIYQPFGVKLHTDEMVSAVLLGGITAQNLALQTTTERNATSGDPYAQFVAVTGQKPELSLSTYSLAAAIDAVGFAGLKITSGTNPGIVQYLAKIDPATGQPASGSVHISRTFKAGIVYLERLTVDHQGQASLSLRVRARWDGTNDPVVLATSVALPTGLTDPTRFTLGSATIAGVTIDRKQSLEVDFGLNLEAVGADSDIWPRWIHLTEALPGLSIRGLNPDDFAAAGIPLIGAGATHANTELKLRKRTNHAASFVADATAEHISLTAYGAAYWDTAVDAQGNSRAGVTLRVDLAHDGTNLPIVIDTTDTL